MTSDSVGEGGTTTLRGKMVGESLGRNTVILIADGSGAGGIRSRGSGRRSGGVFGLGRGDSDPTIGGVSGCVVVGVCTASGRLLLIVVVFLVVGTTALL